MDTFYIMNEDLRRRCERLRYRSWHRGTREMDLLLGSFADENLGRFSFDQLDDYEQILETGDPDLYDWITGRTNNLELKDNSVLKLLQKHQLVYNKDS